MKVRDGVGIVLCIIVLLISLFFLFGCSSKDAKLEILKVRACQLACLNANMSFAVDGMNDYSQNDTSVSIQCKCIAYLEVQK